MCLIWLLKACAGAEREHRGFNVRPYASPPRQPPIWKGDKHRRPFKEAEVQEERRSEWGDWERASEALAGGAVARCLNLLCFCMQIPLVRTHLIQSELSERAGYGTKNSRIHIHPENIWNANAMRRRCWCARVCVRIRSSAAWAGWQKGRVQANRRALIPLTGFNSLNLLWGNTFSAARNICHWRSLYEAAWA